MLYGSLYEKKSISRLSDQAWKLNNYVGAKLVWMVDWSTIELSCSNLMQWEGPSMNIGTRFTWPGVVTSSLYVSVPKVKVHSCLTRIVACYICRKPTDVGQVSLE